MKQFQFNIQLNSVFDNILRKKHVLIAVVDNKGRIILGSKSRYYPREIHRLVGGGIDDGETPEVAAVRELREELGVRVIKSNLRELIEIDFDITYQDELYPFVTYIYRYELGNQAITAADDIDAVVVFEQKDLKALIQRYKALNEVALDNHGRFAFNWADYGKVYGKIHELVRDEIYKS